MKYMENTNIISDVVINWANYQLTSNIVCDFLLSLITNVNGGTIGPCNGVADGYRNEISPHLNVQHQYKRYYGIGLPEEIAHLVDKSPKDNVFLK